MKFKLSVGGESSEKLIRDSMSHNVYFATWYFLQKTIRYTPTNGGGLTV